MIAKIKERYLYKALGFFALVLMLAFTAAFPAFAATRTKITSVKISILEDDIKPETRYGTETIDIDVDNGHYYFDYYEVDDDGVEWRADQIPRIIVHLRVDDSDKYYFSSTLRNNFTVVGGTYVSGTLNTTDSATELYFTVELTPMDERVGDIEEVTLTDSGYVYWDAPIGAGSYEIRLYRNDALVSTTDIKTDATEYNLKDYMNRAGSYYARVRACNSKKPETKSSWTDSPMVTISTGRANEIREGLSFERPLKGDWVKMDDGWTYRYEDGHPAEPGWLYLDGNWFYFDQDSRMMTGWISVDGEDYYMDDITGRMLTNTTTPDGYILDENGHRKTDR